MELSYDHANAAPTAARDAYSTKRFSSWFCWSLAFILLLGVALRIGHINHKIYHVDEQIAESVLRGLSFPTQWDTNWAKTAVGSGFRYDQYNFSSYHYLLYFWKSLLEAFGIEWIHHPEALRAFNGLCGLVFLGAIALATRQLVGELAGIAAASAGAIMPLLVEDAHYVRCEAMLTAGLTLLLWLSIRRVSVPRWALFSSGFITGWMLACKATMGLALPLLLLILINAISSKPTRWSLWFFPAGIVGLGLVSGVVIGVPWGVAQPHIYHLGLAGLAKQYRSPMWPYTTPDMSPSIWATLDYMKVTVGWGFWTVAVLGLGRLIRISGWWRTALFLAPLAGAFAVFGSHAFFAERSYSPFLPIVIVLFGAGLQLVIETIVRQYTNLRKHSLVLLALLLTLTLTLPAFFSWQLVFQIFSGHEQIEKDAALARMKGNLTGKVVRMFSIDYYASNYREIAAAVGNNEPVLVVLVDYYDSLSPIVLTTLQDNYGGRILGVRESIFPSLPPCFLNTILSPRLWLVYIPAKENRREVEHPRGTDKV